ncbi:L-glutamate gamma-semialdehyde dehydrogenase [Desulfofustis limnaeus]|jgi:1-pyrroline-5-carboxylate dehydrogenase|uniref:L-glutamate gamma-semialdehyde dehydrogenase n=1 Tax=Desulfofustis limnaeus TaxID=2740163 RepID=A0ABM7W408_9BACT|nr:L-glutamate gamma-semialdehyde dehydrogenase [Desulfofustis limnaeus]MDX9896145.1 L-glutamate gamma-semialdehyde dehydrogenase [Desulfofustis sp.]BDD85648.1 1-pyrroline-5-carboxylate dehydrogenase [Desulfofustis limnaeus]
MNLLNNAVIETPYPENEPILDYAPGTEARRKLKEALKEMAGKRVEIPLVIGGERITTGDMGQVVMPHDHNHVLAEYHKASEREARLAIEAALEARKTWQSMRWEERCAIFLKAAELLARKYRYLINAGSMLSTSKNAFQAEIDAACELIDFLRFNVHFAERIYREQPRSAPGIWNYLQHRPLEGFVLAVTPFNFTAIAGNLPSAPAIMGNTVVWKPASSCVYTPHLFMQILEEAGLPAGVINFLPGPGRLVGDVCLKDPNLAGVHFTGSTAVFQQMWRTIGEHIATYKSYPRIVGETGGKDFVVVHQDADVDQVVTALVRGAFEYQGQKCSAVSRAYIPQSLWKHIRSGLERELTSLPVGPPQDFRNFVNAVIDRQAFTSITGFIDQARQDSTSEIIIGGGSNDRTGYFIEPTVIVTKDPQSRTMVEEIFGPVLTIYVYEDDAYLETLEICDKTSRYALTGAVFSRSRAAISLALAKLEQAAGNFYINDKPTGAVVGQQPFGGGRASGTNDKAGFYTNLLRWVSPRTVKETFLPPTTPGYPFLEQE